MLRQTGRVLSAAPPPPTSEAVNSSLLSTASFYPISSPLWAAGFSFSESELLLEVPYDPLLPFLFFGEEVSMAARMYTRGFDFFAPAEAVVYHLWTRNNRPTFSSELDQESYQFKKLSECRVLRLLSIPQNSQDLICTDTFTDADFGVFGLGNIRSLGQFEQRVGISFSDKLVLPHAKYAGIEAYYFTQTFTSDQGSESNDYAESTGIHNPCTVAVHTRSAALSLVHNFLTS